MSLPSCYDYLDFRAWLRDWYEAKKADNPRFSHRAFVRRTGQKSPSLLADVMEGRRNLTTETTAAFAKALRLDADETRFFGTLVRFDQARTDEERNAAYAEIASSKRFQNAQRIEGEGFRYLSEWHLPAIAELAHRPDFRADPEWIATTLRPPITAETAASALQTLEALGMLVVTDDGVEARDGFVKTRPEVSGLAVHNYHRGMLALAHDAIDTFEPAERHFCGVTIAIPASAVGALKDELNAMQRRLVELCDAEDGDPSQVVQIELAFFPLTDTK